MPPSLHRLVGHVIATTAYVAHAFELSLDLHDVTTDDHPILLDQIDAAGRHLADAVWTLHPNWRGMDARTAENKALQLFRKHRPEIDEDERGRDAAVAAIQRAIDRSLEGAVEARRHGAERRTRDVAADLDAAVDHLEIALYILDPESFRISGEATTPAQRVKLASRLEIIEMELDEHRAILRASGLPRLGAEMN